MKRTLITLWMLCWTTFATAQVSVLSPFLGVWVNAHSSTRFVTRMEILQLDGQTQVHTWHANSPTHYDGGTVNATLHTETTPPGLPRRNGTVLRSPARADAPNGDMLLMEQAASGLLTVTYLITGPRGPTFERMTFRRYSVRADCLPYNPATVTLRGNNIMAGSSILLSFDDPRNRDLGMALARSFARYCTIGGGNARAEPLLYLFEYWEGGRRGDTAPTADCLPYDPARLRIANRGAEGFVIERTTPTGVASMHLFDTLADATAGLEVFRRHTRQCFIGRGAPGAFQYLL
jgi:hypothetical protein